MHSTYLAATEERAAAFQALARADREDAREIEREMNRLLRLSHAVAHWRAKTTTMSDEWARRNASLRGEKEAMTRHYQTLKAQMDRCRRDHARRTRALAEGSGDAADALRAATRTAERVLVLSGLCRRLETEEEKVLPFWSPAEALADELLAADGGRELVSVDQTTKGAATSAALAAGEKGAAAARALAASKRAVEGAGIEAGDPAVPHELDATAAAGGRTSVLEAPGRALRSVSLRVGGDGTAAVADDDAASAGSRPTATPPGGPGGRPSSSSRRVSVGQGVRPGPTANAHAVLDAKAAMSSASVTPAPPGHPSHRPGVPLADQPRVPVPDAEILAGFHKRVHRATLDAASVARSRDALRAENAELRRLLRHYLDGISVPADATAGPANPLLVINERLQRALAARRAGQAGETVGTASGGTAEAASEAEAEGGGLVLVGAAAGGRR